MCGGGLVEVVTLESPRFECFQALVDKDAFWVSIP